MMSVTFLKWYESLAFWVLWRSPRVGCLFVRQFNSNLAFYANDPNESESWWLMDDESNDAEVAAHELERLYHMPSFGEDE